jgi:phosphatidylglycerol:prolipoprotein diacylglycerol transferase
MLFLRCYAKITDWIFEVFNHAPAADYRFLPVFSYGFWVAVGFFAAATLATIELRRREKLGLLPGEEKEETYGEAPNNAELAFYFIFGFILAFKLIGLVTYQPQLSTGAIALKDFMLSIKGNWIAGILGGGALAYNYWRTKKKEQLPAPKTRIVKTYPSDNMGDLVVLAAVLGVLGAVLFNFLESSAGYDRFWEDPIGFLTNGLSIYGGLICAGAGFAIYARKKNLHIGHFFDAIVPGVMLANGLGRIGCQVSGDGDWGITNTAPKPDWLPQWLWSDYYPHNIVNESQGVTIPGCLEEHCNQLAHPAYPTPIYEFLMCTVVFLILWSLRKPLTSKPGMVFSIFMILIGIQRFAIEQWRAISDRELYHIFGWQLKQSELISVILFLAGTALSLYLWNYYTKKQPRT